MACTILVCARAGDRNVASMTTHETRNLNKIAAQDFESRLAVTSHCLHRIVAAFPFSCELALARRIAEPKSVIPACFKRESTLFRTGPPIKTFGGDSLKANFSPWAQAFDSMTVDSRIIQLPLLTMVLNSLWRS